MSDLASRLACQEVVRMDAQESQVDEVNEVTLVGRMSQPAEEQVLPSGSELWKFRVIVGRPPSPASRVTVDALDCVVWAKRPARSVAGWRTGGGGEVRGSLRRRFFAPSGGREGLSVRGGGVHRAAHSSSERMNDPRL